MTSGSVLQVITSTERRGAETFALVLEHALHSRNWAIRTVALHTGKHHDVDVEALGSSARGLTTLRALRRAANEHDLVVAHGSTTLSACAIALLRSGTPFVYRNIGDPDYWSNTPTSRARTGAFLKRAAAVVALTDGSARALEQRFGVADGKAHVIPTGVSSVLHQPASDDERREARHALGIPLERRVALIIGALSSEKGVDIAIAALAVNERLDTLLIAGDGPDRAELEAEALARAPGRARFLGSVDNVSHVYPAADIVVLSSRTEGLPAVLIEAGMRGIPVVATDVGYVRDIVADGVSGIVVRPEDARALAQGIDRALELGDAAGRAARAHCCSRFELELVAELWDALLQETRPS